jgi:hypothetical protein
MNLKTYNPNELSKNIKLSQREKNDQIKKTLVTIESMYNELKNK